MIVVLGLLLALLCFSLWEYSSELLRGWLSDEGPHLDELKTDGQRKRLTFVDVSGAVFGDISIATVNASRGQQKGVLFEHDAELFLLRIGGDPENYFVDRGSAVFANMGYLNDACTGKRVYRDTAEAFAQSQRSQHALPLAYLQGTTLFRMTLSEQQISRSQLTLVSSDKPKKVNVAIWRLQRQADGTVVCKLQKNSVLIPESGVDEWLSMPIIKQVRIRDVDYEPPLHLELR